MGKRLTMLVATMALVAASCGGGTVETAAAESDALDAGIGVHGAWTVTVVEPDGSVASTTEFTNDLDTPILLNGLVTRAFSTGSWVIELLGHTDVEPPCGGTSCRIVEPLSTVAGADSTNLELEPVALDSSGPHRTRLSGSVEITDDSEIVAVRTLNHVCSGSPESPTSPHQCATEGGDSLISLTLASLDFIPVAAGQTVQVEVEISFGTLTTP